jgi:hypothetical protein
MNPENPANNQQAKPNTGAEPNKQSTDSAPEPPSAVAEPQAKPSPHCYKITCDGKRDWIDKATLGLEAFGLFVLIVYTSATIVYACITYKMWIEMQTQSGNQRSTFMVDQRAWVGVDVKVTAVNHVTHTIDFEVILKNTGKTPALNVYEIQEITSAPRQTVPPFTPPKIEGLRIPRSPSPPNPRVFTPDQIREMNRVEEEANKRMEEFVGAQENHFVIAPDAAPSIPIHGFNFGEKVTDGTERGYVLGQVTYKDIFGQTHKTDFSFFYTGAEPTIFRMNTSGNDMN